MESKNLQILIIYDKYGLRVNRFYYNLLDFCSVKSFRSSLEKLVKGSIVEIKDSSIVLSNGRIIDGDDLFNDVQFNNIRKICSVLDWFFMLKRIRTPRLYIHPEFGLIINEMRYFISVMARNCPNFEDNFLKFLRGSSTLIENGMIMVDGVSINYRHKCLYDYIVYQTCHKSLAYCCGLKKDCVKRNSVMEALSITNDEYEELKRRWERMFCKFVRKKFQWERELRCLRDIMPTDDTSRLIYDSNILNFRTFYKIISEATCFGLAYCCGPLKPCFGRNSILIALHTTLSEYVKAKDKLNKDFELLSRLKNPSFFNP